MADPFTAPGGLVVKGLSHLASLGFTRLSSRFLRKRAAYNAAFSEERQLPAAVEIAMSDLRSVIGRAGLLDIDFDRLLTEITSSGLLEHICLAALTGVNPNGTRAAFNAVYLSVLSSASSKQADELFDLIVRLLHASFTNSQSTLGNLLTELTVKQRLVNSAIESEEKLAIAFSPQDESGEPVTRDELLVSAPWIGFDRAKLNARIAKINGALFNSFNFIRVEGPSYKSLTLEADKIYVSPSLKPSVTREISLYETSQTIPVEEFLSSLDRAVILGNPGGGKTTLARMICRDTAYAHRVDGLVLPIFVTLRYFEAQRAQDPQLSLLSYIYLDILRASNHTNDSFNENDLRSILVFGKAIIVFDALDEILSIGARRSFVAEVLSFTSSFNLCRYILTSRRVGYEQAAVSTFELTELAPFSEDAIRRYVLLSAKNVFAKTLTDEELEKHIDSFIVRANEHAGEFVGSPLLLSLIVWLYNSTARIPDDRADLYGECARLMFDRWDVLREISAEVPSPHRLFSLLVHLSKPFFLTADLQGGASREWLADAIKDFFLRDYKDDAEARASDAAAKLVTHLTGRAWVLRESRQDRFEFTHRTFLEYFFALHLDEEHETVGDLLAHLEKRIKKGEWNVVAHLALQLKSRHKPTRANDAARRLMAMARSAQVDDIGYVLDFVAESTRYLQPTEHTLQELSRLITSRIGEPAAWRKYIIYVLDTPNEMWESIARGLGEGIGDLLGANELHRAGIVADWLKASAIADKREFALEPVKRISGRTFTPLIKKILEPLEGKPELTAVACKLRFDLNGEFDAGSIAALGLGVWKASAERPMARVDWREVDFFLMTRELSDVNAGRSDLEVSRYAQLAMALYPVGIAQAPYLIASEFIVSEIFDDATLNRIGFEEISDVEIGCALCFSMMGYIDMAKRYREGASLSVASHALIATVRDLVEKLDRLAAEPRHLAFFRSWLDGSTRLFAMARRSLKNITIDNILGK